ncbi:MAG: hypothetical protein WA880_01150 [Ornithinimicrobium sp.]
MTTQPDPDADAGPDDDARAPEEERDSTPSGGQVSEAGGASLNAETSQGGADAVPDSHG